MSKWTDISMIYPDEEEIVFSEKFLDEVENRRKRKNFSDKKLLEDKEYIVDLEKMVDLPDGRVKFLINNARFECFFKRGKTKRLYVILDGARTSSGGKKRDIPIFSRWSYYSFTEYSWLSIEDPMYYDNDDLLLGWFWGDNERNYRQYVADIVSKITLLLEIDKADVVFLGGSGGGTVAIHAAALFGGGTAISINGQINFEYEKYNTNIKKFIDCTGIDIYKKDKYNRNDLCKIMKEHIQTKFILVENCLSRWDYNDHMSYFCKRLDITPIYGLSQFGNIYTYIYEAGGKSPHSSFENKNIFFALDFLAKLVVKNENIERYKALFLLFNEFWYDIYCEEKKRIPKSEIKFLNDNVLRGKKYFYEKISKLIEATEDNYHCYRYSKFRTNMIYHIEVRNLISDSDLKRITIGLFDYDKRQFIVKREYNLDDTINFDFLTGSYVGNIGFCVFAGIHGDTAGKNLNIGEIKICFQFAKI